MTLNSSASAPPLDSGTRRVLIVGCGYVGSAVGAALARSGWQVTGTTTTEDRFDELAAHKIKPARLRIDDDDALQRLLAESDVVLLTIAAGRHRQGYADVYGTAASAVARWLPTSPARRLIYTSSTRVYGQDDGSWVTETSPAEPASPDARVLRQAEETLLGCATATGPFVTVLRLSGIYGPGRDVERFIARAAGSVRSDGAAYLNLVHRDDIVEAMTRLASLAHTGILNLADDEPTLRREWYDRLLEEAGRPAVTWQADDGSAQALGKRVANRLIKDLLGLTLRHPRH